MRHVRAALTTKEAQRRNAHTYDNIILLLLYILLLASESGRDPDQEQSSDGGSEVGEGGCNMTAATQICTHTDADILHLATVYACVCMCAGFYAVA